MTHGRSLGSPDEPVRVLVVDDDFAVASLHRAYVEGLPGFTVVAEAHTARQALRAVDELHPELVLLDIHLPDMSGVEALHRLRARPDGRSLDVIAITAAREVETVRAAMTGGVADYLIKPFTLQVFRERLEVYAAQRRELRRRTAANVNATVRDQRDVDRILTPRRGGTAQELPKGLSQHTLSLVAAALRDADGDLSAGEAAARCGLSRVSCRRYLEQLSAMGLAEVRPRYGSTGRPENGYRWVGHAD
jgi:two-component system CitB family response regulator